MMKRIKNSYSYYLSVLLLLVFSAIFLPLDAFHNHAPLATTSQNSSGEKLISSDKQILDAQSNNDYCWVCAVHFDKTFTKTNFIEKVRLSPIMSVFLNNEITGYVAELLLSSLRGPPAE